MSAPLPHPRPWRGGAWPPVLVLAAGTALGLLLWDTTRERVRSDAESAFRQVAAEARARLGERFSSSRARLTACRALFASDDVDAEGLGRFLRAHERLAFAGSGDVHWLPADGGAVGGHVTTFDAPEFVPVEHPGGAQLAKTLAETLEIARGSRGPVLHLSPQQYLRPADLPAAALVECVRTGVDADRLHEPREGEVLGWIVEPVDLAALLARTRQHLSMPVALRLEFEGAGYALASHAAEIAVDAPLIRSHLDLGDRSAAFDVQLESSWRPSFAAAVLPTLVLIACILVSASVAALLLALSGTARRARQLAQSMNRSMHAVTAGVPGVVYRLRRQPSGRLAFEFLSEGFRELFGVAPEECLDHPRRFVERIAPPDRVLASETLERSASTLERWFAELRVMQDDGSTRWLRVHALPMRDEDGSIVWNGIALDVTESLESERRASDLAKILEGATTEAYIFDADTLRVLQANRRALENTGYDAAELAGLEFHELEIGTTAKEARRQLEPLRRGRVAELRVTAHVRRKDGTSYPAEVQLQLSRFRGAPAFVALAVDITKRREAEAALVASQERLDLAIRGSSDGLWDWHDVSKDEAWWSPRMYALLGYADGAVPSRGSRFRQWVHPDDRAGLADALREHLKSGAAFDIEVRVRVRTGDYRWFRVRGDSTRDAANRAVRMAGSLTDVTDRREAEDALRASEQRLVLSLSAAGIGCWDLAVADGTMRGDERARALLGMPSGAPSSGLLDFLRSVHPEDRDRVTEVFLESLQGGPPFATEFRVLVGESLRYVGARGNTLLDSAGRPTRMVGVLWDVTESRLREAELRRSAELLHEMQRISGVGGWEYDVGAGTLFWTDEVRRLHEVPDDFAPTIEDAISFYAPESVPVLQAALRAALDEGVPFDLELRFHTAKGRELWVRAQGRPAVVDGRTVRVSGTFQDISERKRAELEMIEARDLAEAASRAKSEFLANMSHEIRTPMTAILGYAELLLEPGAPEDVRLEQVRTIMRNGDHLLAILNDILDLSKIEAGKLRLEQDVFELRSLVAEVGQLMRVRADAKGLAFEVEVALDAPVHIATDAVRLRQVLMNLVGNAVKFTEQGSVALRVRRAGEGEAERLLFEIIDTGIGMGADEIERLFQPFDQVDASAARRFGGTGLGLAISRRLAHMLGGEITVDSQLGAGSTFRLELGLRAAASPRAKPAPARPPARPPAPPPALATPATTAEAPAGAARAPARLALDAAPPVLPASAAGRPLAGVRVLLAEDGPDNQRLISHHLRRAGADVTIADNGRIAVDLLAAARSAGASYDVVLMDMQMPILDGYGAAAELRARGIGVPVIALTAHAMAGDRERCLESGCDDFASKPVRGALLVERVLHWARTMRAMDAAPVRPDADRADAES